MRPITAGFETYLQKGFKKSSCANETWHMAQSVTEVHNDDRIYTIMTWNNHVVTWTMCNISNAVEVSATTLKLVQGANKLHFFSSSLTIQMIKKQCWFERSAAAGRWLSFRVFLLFSPTPIFFRQPPLLYLSQRSLFPIHSLCPTYVHSQPHPGISPGSPSFF